MKNNIDKIRVSKNLTNERLAEKVGTSLTQVFRLKSGERRLTTGWLARFAKALDCSITELALS